MAKIKRGIVKVAYQSKEYEETAEKFFEDFEEILDEAGIEYEHQYVDPDEDDFYWLYDKKFAIAFRCFRQKTDNNGLVTDNIYLILKNSWPQLFSGESSTGTDTLYYEIILSSYGDVMVRMANGALENNSKIVFVICKCNNIINPSNSGIGLYAPWTQADSEGSTTQDCTPKFLVTEDTDLSIPIVNNVSNANSSGTMHYIVNTNASITALVPITAVSSQCVSINTKIMAIAPAPITGYATLNGQRYYCVGMICMADDEE
jgi:hypothetical protein